MNTIVDEKYAAGREFTPEELHAIPVIDLVPQRPPMLMIDKMDEFTPEICSTLTVVGPDNIFVEDGRFGVAGIVENMAQTCAARLGFVDRLLKGNAISIGYIGAVKNFTVSRLPLTGETLKTTIRTVTEAFGMTLVEARMTVGHEEIACCELKIALAPQPKENMTL